MSKPEKPIKMPRIHPTFTVDEVELPEIKDWEVGKEYDLDVRVRMVRKSKGDTYPLEGVDREKPKMEASFRIVSIESDEEEEKGKGKKKLEIY